MLNDPFYYSDLITRGEQVEKRKKLYEGHLEWDNEPYFISMNKEVSGNL